MIPEGQAGTLVDQVGQPKGRSVCAGSGSSTVIPPLLGCSGPRRELRGTMAVAKAGGHTPLKPRPRCAGNDASMPAFLKELNGEDAFELGDFALIGRNDGATIRLLDSSISRQHASIRREDLDFWIVDLSSSNGTYVNDVAVTSARSLRHGDRVQLGSMVLIFQQSDGPDRQVFAVNAKTQISALLPAPAMNFDATLLVADLRGFTMMSAQLSAGEVADLLREWYADCMDILKRHHASIDKFIGDGVFAYWYRADADARRSALMAAQALRTIEGISRSPARQSSTGAPQSVTRLQDRPACRQGGDRCDGQGDQYGCRRCGQHRLPHRVADPPGRSSCTRQPGLCRGFGRRPRRV